MWQKINYSAPFLFAEATKKLFVYFYCSFFQKYQSINKTGFTTKTLNIPHLKSEQHLLFHMHYDLKSETACFSFMNQLQDYHPDDNKILITHLF
ncbi:MAG: hypothetical protein CSA36_04740 [Draconibacterium sp.]|nr:MAG: hypothetical protein CSA36_04740 [Draconibacterium sp.]